MNLFSFEETCLIIIYNIGNYILSLPVFSIAKIMACLQDTGIYLPSSIKWKHFRSRGDIVIGL